ncbi:hypothetical protein FQA47_013837 [Oryzias melastigma]|uniref:Uncharacterized protein n=1 Tax=Oryzias melastigma TaxID=30732 RepID=A0A834F3W2_ORYME|nr:hypothetical protein FQA47_013837 [Oryzias melastigma]
MQMNTDICSPTYTNTEDCRRMQTNADQHRSTQINTDQCRGTETSTDHHRRKQTNADYRRPTQTVADQHNWRLIPNPVCTFLLNVYKEASISGGLTLHQNWVEPWGNLKFTL